MKRFGSTSLRERAEARASGSLLRFMDVRGTEKKRSAAPEKKSREEEDQAILSMGQKLIGSCECGVSYLLGSEEDAKAHRRLHQRLLGAGAPNRNRAAKTGRSNG